MYLKNVIRDRVSGIYLVNAKSLDQNDIFTKAENFCCDDQSGDIFSCF